VSQLAVWEIDFPGGISIDNIKWRVFIWAISEGLFILAIAINYLPPRLYSIVFRVAIGVMMLDFLLCLIWLPIGVSKTYGFRSAREVFTGMCMSSLDTFSFTISDVLFEDNGTGAPAGWNWILSLYALVYCSGWNHS
jgi:translation initiation factor 5B